MARNYGRIATAIWRDEDFLALSTDARFTYLMLLSQPNISPCGVLELTERRWARNLGFDCGPALDELVAHRFLVIDQDTEEVLIRTFVKWDGGANNDLRRRAITDSAEAVASLSLRAAIAPELVRNGLDKAPSKPYRSPIEALSEAHREPMDSPSIEPRSPVEGRRVVVKKRIPEPQPQPLTTTQNQSPSDSPSIVDTSTPEPPAAPAETAMKGKPRLPSGLRSAFEEFWAAYPRRTARAEAERKFAIAARDTEPALIVAAAKRYAAAVANSEPRFIAHPSTWLHQGRWDDEPVAQAVGAIRRKPWEDENGRQIGPIPWWAEQ